MTTTTANLNLRPAAGTNNTPLLVIPDNSPVTVTGDPWYPVSYDGTRGWVSGRYLDLDGPPTDTQTPYDDYVSDAMALAERMQGLWYRWGGNFTQKVFTDKRGDCSGYVGFVSETMGYQPGNNPLYNYSADSMFDNFRTGVWQAERIEPGNERAMDIVFYGNGDHAGHVVFARGDGTVIGSSGGYRSTVNDTEARRVGAKVRIDELHFHSNPIVGIFRPPYGEGR